MLNIILIIAVLQDVPLEAEHQHVTELSHSTGKTRHWF